MASHPPLPHQPQKTSQHKPNPFTMGWTDSKNEDPVCYRPLSLGSHHPATYTAYTYKQAIILLLALVGGPYQLMGKTLVCHLFSGTTQNTNFCPLPYPLKIWSTLSKWFCVCISFCCVAFFSFFGHTKRVFMKKDTKKIIMALYAMKKNKIHPIAAK